MPTAEEARMARLNKNLQEILDQIPDERDFEITCHASDSTNEVWVDIDTDMQVDTAWWVYGVEWIPENATPTVPLLLHGLGVVSGVVMGLQLHFNDDNELFLKHNDNDLLFNHHVELDQAVATQGASSYLMHRPFYRPCNKLAYSPTLRAIFRTTTALANLDNQKIRGKIKYDIVSVPNNQSGKALRVGGGAS